MYKHQKQPVAEAAALLCIAAVAASGNDRSLVVARVRLSYRHVKEVCNRA